MGDTKTYFDTAGLTILHQQYCFSPVIDKDVAVGCPAVAPAVEEQTDTPSTINEELPDAVLHLPFQIEEYSGLPVQVSSDKVSQLVELLFI